MVSRKEVARVVLAVALSLAIAGVASAQVRPGRGEGRGERPQRGERLDPAEMQQRMLERQLQRIQTQLDMSDEEMAALQPKFEAVMQRARDVAPQAGMMAGRGRRGAEAAQPQTPVEQSAAALREALADEDAAGEEINAKVEALRKAREEAQEKLAEAQAELRQFLTARQEAQLVLMGILD